MFQRVGSSDEHSIQGNRERTDLSNGNVRMGADASVFQSSSALRDDVSDIGSSSSLVSISLSSFEIVESGLIIPTEELVGLYRSNYMEGYFCSSAESGPSLCKGIHSIIHYDYDEERFVGGPLEEVQNAEDSSLRCAVSSAEI